MTPTSLLVPTYANLLTALDGWLAKAEAGPGDSVLAARLAPDMFPLATQLRFACAQAYEGTARLAGEPLPPEVAALLDEGRAGGEAPGTLAEARARIAATLGYLQSLAPDALDSDPAAPLEHALPMGIVFDFTAGQYLRDWAIPQFLFHVMAAYAILRAQGVPLGKADYVGHLMPFVRPATMPSG